VADAANSACFLSFATSSRLANTAPSPPVIALRLLPTVESDATYRATG
jgi:hypothetical protein